LVGPKSFSVDLGVELVYWCGCGVDSNAANVMCPCFFVKILDLMDDTFRKNDKNGGETLKLIVPVSDWICLFVYLFDRSVVFDRSD